MIPNKQRTPHFRVLLTIMSTPADGTRVCRANLPKNTRRTLSAIPGIKKAFVNLLTETLFTLFKSFLLYGLISDLWTLCLETLLLSFYCPEKQFSQMEIYGNYCDKYHIRFQIEFCYPTFSITNLKLLLYNAYIINHFFHVGFTSERCENRAQSQACLTLQNNFFLLNP